MYLAGNDYTASALQEMETTLASNSQDSQNRTDANFKKEQRARDGALAMKEYEASIIAAREKTARLRALRLAKEAAETKATKSEAATKPAEIAAKPEPEKKKGVRRAPAAPKARRR